MRTFISVAKEGRKVSFIPHLGLIFTTLCLEEQQAGAVVNHRITDLGGPVEQPCRLRQPLRCGAPGTSDDSSDESVEMTTVDRNSF